MLKLKALSLKKQWDNKLMNKRLIKANDEREDHKIDSNKDNMNNND